MAEPEQTPTQALLDGRYRLGECIGEGGMARVHRGEDLILERTVAVKMIRASDGGTSSVARTRGEVAVLASLSHPSLVTLLDARVVPGEPEYLVMEFIDGPTLRDRLDIGPLTPRDVALLGTELAEALHVVHAAGVVHRDVKPSNVLLAATELPERPFRTKLADFGIAHLLDSSRLTSPGIVVGTPAYLAPEQARGAPPAPAADIFALGVVLLEALTGAPPFGEATGVEAMVARQTLAPPIPDWVGPEWTDLLRSMTALDPAVRPSAMEVASACYRLLSHAPITSSAPPVPAAPVIPPVPPLPDASTPADSSPGVAASGRQHVGSPTVQAPPIPIPTVPLPLAASLHASGPVSTISAGSPARHVRGRSARGRRLVFAGGTAAAMTAVVAGTIWVMGLDGAVPEPAMTIPAVQPTMGPTEAEQDAGTETDNGTEVETVAEDPNVPADEPKPAAPEAPKGPGAPGERPGGGPDKAEQEREKAEREREKAERAAERAEEKQRKAEERAQEKEEREKGQKGNG